MLTKRDLLSKLSSTCLNINLSRQNVIIVGGGASLLNGLRFETQDIDVICPRDTYWDLAYLPSLEASVDLEACGTLPACESLTIQGVDFVATSAFDRYPTFNHRHFKVLTKLGLLQYRIDLGREKDIEDINLLKDLWSKLNAQYTDRLNKLLEINS